MTGFCGPPSRATRREGWELTSWEDAVRRVASARMTAAPDGAGSPARMLYILELFSAAEPVWSTAAIIEALETSRSTGYRYIKTLHDAGLLTAVRNGYYGLGPRIIEMDLQLRQTDPLLLASHGVLEDLVDKIGHSALLCTAYGDSVLCIGEYRAPLESGQPVQPRAAPPLVSRSSVEGHPGLSPPSPPESHLPSSAQGNGDCRAGQHVERTSARPWARSRRTATS